MAMIYSVGGRAVLLVCCLVVLGCNAPQWRVFQSKVPAPLAKSAVQVEAERAGADLVARTIEKPVELVPVAQKLSESLGAPEHPITQSKPIKARGEALDGLNDGIKESQRQLVLLNEKLSKVDGAKIEGTGVNVFGFAVSLPIIGLIALCIFFPSTIGVLWWLLKKSKGALVATIKGVQDFKDSQPVPEVVTELNASLSKKMDDSHKKLVKKIKATL